ncbi:MAG TPA: tRNA (adenosine(37)-N6)-threonylcarbamoyltransferase complex dimerization subunit type 1 TsaB [Candidatus Limnocylindrales bacterium]|nr:tRNA (adenosine(37)-N6)-threonylcarbamoyltransferase complex dimerization subunit type 1 TsaB [Candidatus Limnocylindrales bacterium]
MSRGQLLIIDTATRTPVVALADEAGTLLGEQRWESRHRHGEELLERIDRLLAEAGTGKSDLVGVVVGTGPGSFTGLRIGLATAKTIAYALAIPVVGISTTVAIAHASEEAGERSDEVVVTLPAGAVDRYEHRVRLTEPLPIETDAPRLVAEPAADADGLIAIDLDAPLVSEAAIERGRQAMEGLAAALARLGAARLTAGEADDLAELVPAYVALPRGIAKAAAEMEWLPDLR